MKLEEALPALRAGKRVRISCGGTTHVVTEWKHLREFSSDWLESDNWSIVEEPATDEELAAAFESRAEQIWRKHGVDGPGSEYDSLYEAADMVRKRYVDPSWKVPP
jgi:hypothetical protein